MRFKDTRRSWLKDSTVSIREKLTDIVEYSAEPEDRYGPDLGTLEKIEKKIETLANLTGRVLQQLNEQGSISDERIHKILGTGHADVAEKTD